MILLNIIWPVFGMVLLTFGVWFTRQVQRFAHMRATPPAAEDLTSREAGLHYFAAAGRAADNLINLFEMPVLFFALVPLLVFAGQASAAQVVLAWLFVLLRAAHSVIHIGSDQVRSRFTVYLVSCAVLLAMWIGFGIDTIGAAARYSRAVQAIASQP